MRVLIVEDEFILSEIIKAFLENNNIDSEIAGNADEAYEMIDNGFDAILCDVGLPDGDGFEVLARSREVLGDSGILIAMSGNHQEALDYQCYKFKIDAFLGKPFSEETVLAALEKSTAKVA